MTQLEGFYITKRFFHGLIFIVERLARLERELAAKKRARGSLLIDKDEIEQQLEREQREQQGKNHHNIVTSSKKVTNEPEMNEND